METTAGKTTEVEVLGAKHHYCCQGRKRFFKFSLRKQDEVIENSVPIKGRSFRHEMTALQQAVGKNLPIEKKEFHRKEGKLTLTIAGTQYVAFGEGKTKTEKFSRAFCSILSAVNVPT